jgi:hypothetical protein
MTTFKKFLENIQESSLEIYHGDSFGLTQINNNYSRMYGKDSNVQEGIGIYFSKSLDVAQGYGKKVVKTTVDVIKLLPSRADVSSKIPLPKVVMLLKEIANSYNEFWMMFTDYGFEVESNKEITDKMYSSIAKTMSNNEIRNFQIELVQASNTQVFVDAWLKVIKKYGTYNKELGFYALMYNNNDINNDINKV